MKQIWVIFGLASAVWGANVSLSMSGETLVPQNVLCKALDEATKMYAAIGVRLEWKGRTTGDGGMKIPVEFATGIKGHPGAVAFTTPFDHVAVVTVMYDRFLYVTERNPTIRATVLAHTLAHEVGHALMRSDAHSPDGVMKAHWSAFDYSRMVYKPLQFSQDDADIIRARLGLTSAAHAAH